MRKLLPPSALGHARRPFVLGTFIVASLLAGCGFGVRDNSPVSGALSMQGKVMGGQQPIGGATIQLYAVGASGYGSAATPLLLVPNVSNAGGAFNITGAYTCPSASSLVYLTATGGNPGITGSANNSASALVALLGRCGNLNAGTHIVISEVTTVAAAWALAPFATGLTNIGSSATNSAGIANAFAMGANLASSDRGQTPGDAPAGASIPTAEINTLSNILAACINSTGASSAACGSLFSNTTAGSAAPTETFGAALSIAQHPGTNVANLYNIVTSTGPFQPTLSTAPNDWTIAVAFAAGTGAKPGVAIDAGGNVLLVNTTELTRLSPAGAVLGSSTAAAGYNVAVDASGTPWVGASPSTSHPTLQRLNSDLSVGGTYTFYSVYSAAPAYDFTGFSFDGAGSAWFTCGYCGTVTKADASGNLVGNYNRGGFHGLNLSIDTGGNVWSADMDGDKIYRYTNNGTAAAGSPTSISPGTSANVAADNNNSVWFASGSVLYKLTSGGALSGYSGLPSTGARQLAIDGSNGPWVIATSGALFGFTSAGAARSATGSYTTPFLTSGSVYYQIAMDGSGNVWIPSNTGPYVVAFVGVATPTVTPLALGVKNGTTGTRP